MIARKAAALREEIGFGATGAVAGFVAELSFRIRFPLLSRFFAI